MPEGTVSLISPPAERQNSMRKEWAWPAWSAAAFVLLLWIRFFWSLTAEWELDPQYAHGWLIPILAGILAHGRYQTRPVLEAPADGRWILWGALAALLPLLPLAFLEA